MSIEQIVYDALVADAPLTAIVEDRIFAIHIPDDVEGAMIAYALAGMTMDAACAFTTQIAVDVYSKSYDETRTMRDLVVTLPDNDWAFTVGNDQYEEDSELYHVVITITIVHSLTR
jgi:hypothetical protein